MLRASKFVPFKIVSSLAICAAIGLAPMSADAAASAGRLAKLKRTWVAALGGNTGCGITSLLVKFTLDTAGHGAGTATVVGHATGCEHDQTLNGQDFNINTFNPDGSGVAGLTCGVGCGWVLSFQVNKQNNAMTMTDVEPTNPNNTPTGVAFKQ